MSGIRVGVDVGGTFTKAVALTTRPFRLLASAVEPTTHEHATGVNAGVAAALSRLLAELGDDAARVELVAFSTTQAMNALLEGDVAKVGVVGIGVSSRSDALTAWGYASASTSAARSPRPSR